MTKEEMKAYRKAYREANKEKIKEYREANKEKMKAYYEENKEEIKAYQKAYREANKEEKKAYDKAYYKENKEEIKAYKKTYREANKEEMKAYQEAYSKTEKGKEAKKEGNKRYLKKLSLANKNISTRTLKAWALQVKERDGNTCQICSSTDKLHAHHILSKGKHPSLALLLNNGITLCEACHIEEHRLNGDL